GHAWQRSGRRGGSAARRGRGRGCRKQRERVQYQYQYKHDNRRRYPGLKPQKAKKHKKKKTGLTPPTKQKEKNYRLGPAQREGSDPFFPAFVPFCGYSPKN